MSATRGQGWRAALVASIALLGAAETSRAEDLARAWKRGVSPPLAEGETLADVPCARGVCRFRLTKPQQPGGPPGGVLGMPELASFLCELLPSELGVPSKAIPQEKRYQELLLKERWDTAVETLDKVLRDPASASFVVRPPGESEAWTSLATLARERLLRLPAEARTAYRALRDGDAAPLLEPALESGSAEELLTLVDRFPVATDAPRALARAGDLLFERGDLALACRAWERALAFYSESVDAPLISSRIARARLLEHARARDQATAATGSFSTPLRLVWRRKVYSPARSLPSVLPGIVPCARGDLIFLHEEEGVSALDLETGRLRWKTVLERGPRWPEDDSPATVAATTQRRDPVVLVRGRRLVFLLDRTTGQVLARVSLADLGGAPEDRIDACECAGGRAYLAAKIGSDRVVFGLAANGSPVFRTVLWQGGSYDACLSFGQGRLAVFADGGIASLDAEGEIRWLRVAYPRDAGLSPERALVRAGERVVALDRLGLASFDPETGSRGAVPRLDTAGRSFERPLPPREARHFDCPGCGKTFDAPGKCPQCKIPLVEREPPPHEIVGMAPVGSATLVLGATDEGPVVLDPDLPGTTLAPLVTIEKGRARLLRLLERRDFPAFPGVVAGGRVYLATEDSVVAFGLVSGEEAGRARCPAGPGRLSAWGETILVAQDRQLLAFAQVPASPPRKLPEDASGLAARLSASDFREREAARAKLETEGEGALAALRLALEASTTNAEGRDACSDMIREIEARRSWKQVLPTLEPQTIDLLASRQSTDRLMALHRLGTRDPAGGAVSSEAAASIERVARSDPDLSVRGEALRFLCRTVKTKRDEVLAILLAQDKVEPQAREGAAELLAASADPGWPPSVRDDLSRAALDERAEVREAMYLACLRRFGPPGLAFLSKSGGSLAQDQAMGRAIGKWTREQGIGLNVRGAPGLVIPESRVVEEQDNEKALLDRFARDAAEALPEKPR